MRTALLATVLTLASVPTRADVIYDVVTPDATLASITLRGPTAGVPWTLSGPFDAVEGWVTSPYDGSRAWLSFSEIGTPLSSHDGTTLDGGVIRSAAQVGLEFSPVTGAVLCYLRFTPYECDVTFYGHGGLPFAEYRGATVLVTAAVPEPGPLALSLALAACGCLCLSPRRV